MVEWITLLIGPITDIVKKFVPDKDKAAEMAHEIATIIEKQAHEAQMGQIDVNKTASQHPSIFVAGARPFILWICGFSMAWTYLIQPMLTWGAWLFPEYQAVIETAPRLDDGPMMVVLLGLLGLGGLRTYEKKHGVARDTLKS